MTADDTPAGEVRPSPSVVEDDASTDPSVREQILVDRVAEYARAVRALDAEIRGRVDLGPTFSTDALDLFIQQDLLMRVGSIVFGDGLVSEVERELLAAGARETGMQTENFGTRVAARQVLARLKDQDEPEAMDERPILLAIFLKADAALGSNHALSYRDLLMSMLELAATCDGPATERESAALEQYRNILDAEINLARAVVEAETGERVEATWAPDPFGRFEQRYWDGSEWTEHVFDEGQAGRDPLT